MDVSYSVYINFIRRIKSFKVLNNKIVFKHRLAFIMTNNMVSSGLWKMLNLPIFILTIDGTIGCVMIDTWYQIVLLFICTSICFALFLSFFGLPLKFLFIVSKTVFFLALCNCCLWPLHFNSFCAEHDLLTGDFTSVLYECQLFFVTVVIESSLMPLINCSFRWLSFSLYLHCAAFILMSVYLLLSCLIPLPAKLRILIVLTSELVIQYLEQSSHILVLLFPYFGHFLYKPWSFPSQPVFIIHTLSVY